MSDPTKTGPSIRRVPDGDTRERLVCPDCGFIVYENPKPVVGAVCSWRNQILLCRRAIAPRIGYWTIPAGFMEMGESTADGATREVFEESKARIRIDSLLGLFEIPWIGQVCVFYGASMLSPDCGPTFESSEARLFAWGEIPWNDLAFPSVNWALRRYAEGGEPAIHVATPLVEPAR